jgi:beta-galactosidase
VGKGHITYCGTVPGSSLAQAIFRRVCAGRPVWGGLPESVTATGATAADGRRLRFLHNWSWDPVTVTAPVTCTDVLSGKRIEQTDAIELTAWDVRVLMERER